MERHVLEALLDAALDAAETAERSAKAVIGGAMDAFLDLISDGSGEIQRLYDFVGLPHDDHMISRVAESTHFSAMSGKRHGGHLRKGVVGDWRNTFSGDDARLFESLGGMEMLRSLGYSTEDRRAGPAMKSWPAGPPHGQET